MRSTGADGVRISQFLVQSVIETSMTLLEVSFGFPVLRGRRVPFFLLESSLAAYPYPYTYPPAAFSNLDPIAKQIPYQCGGCSLCCFIFVIIPLGMCGDKARNC